MRVPLDWDRPGGRRIGLAVVRHLASRPDERIGSMFINPGGPGESGFDLVAGPAGDELDGFGAGRFDVVSWDPRGTNASAPVRCFRSEKGEARFWKGARIPIKKPASRRFRKRTAELARRCGRVSGNLLRQVSTADTARDLDYLRRVVGDRKLTYVGFSYGSLLGQTYANLFPRRVRAMVLDGVVDAVAYSRGAEARTARVVSSADEVFGRFEALCESAGPDRCALAGGRRSVADRVETLFARVRREGVPAPDSRPPGRLSYGDLLLSLFQPLRDPAKWPGMADDLDAALAGDGSALATQGRLMRTPEGWSAATTSAAIQCADAPARRKSRAWPGVIDRFKRVSRLQGPVQGWWLWAPCASWPARAPDRYSGPWDASTKNPILVIGTRHDPSTGYAGARRTARRLDNAVLLTHDGYGHISFTDPSACIERARTAYIVGLDTPRRGTVCASDRRPFDPGA